jgi:hypothetical protein
MFFPLACSCVIFCTAGMRIVLSVDNRLANLANDWDIIPYGYVDICEYISSRTLS